MRRSPDPRGGPGPSGASRGFTLIEVLVTLAIVGLVLSMIASILLAVLDANDRVEAIVKPNRIGPSILALIARDLRGVYAYSQAPSFLGEDHARASVQADAIQFVALVESLPDEDGIRSPICEVGYVVDERSGKPGSYVLFRREARGVDGAPFEGGEYREVYQNVTSFGVEFLGDEDEEWREEWDDDTKVPRAVRVTLKIAPDYETEATFAPPPGIPEPNAPREYVSTVSIPVHNLPGGEQAGASPEAPGSGT